MPCTCIYASLQMKKRWVSCRLIILYVHSDSYYMFISLSFLNITSFKKVIFVIEHVIWWFLVGCFFTVSKTCLESSLAWIWFYFYNTSNYMNDIVKITTKVCQRCDVYSQGHRVSESCIDRKIQVISQELCNGRHGFQRREFQILRGKMA